MENVDKGVDRCEEDMYFTSNLWSNYAILSRVNFTRHNVVKHRLEVMQGEVGGGLSSRPHKTSSEGSIFLESLVTCINSVQKRL